MTYSVMTWPVLSDPSESRTVKTADAAIISPRESLTMIDRRPSGIVLAVVEVRKLVDIGKAIIDWSARQAVKPVGEKWLGSIVEGGIGTDRRFLMRAVVVDFFLIRRRWARKRGVSRYQKSDVAIVQSWPKEVDLLFSMILASLQVMRCALGSYADDNYFILTSSQRSFRQFPMPVVSGWHVRRHEKACVG